MVDYAKINEAMERTRLEVRRIVMAEGADAERAEIVAWLRREANGMFSPNEPEYGLLHAIADAIERGEYKQPERDAGDTDEL